MQESNLQLAPAAIEVIRRVDQSSRPFHAPRGRRGRTVYGVRQDRLPKEIQLCGKRLPPDELNMTHPLLLCNRCVTLISIGTLSAAFRLAALLRCLLFLAPLQRTFHRLLPSRWGHLRSLLKQLVPAVHQNPYFRSMCAWYLLMASSHAIQASAGSPGITRVTPGPATTVTTLSTQILG